MAKNYILRWGHRQVARAGQLEDASIRQGSDAAAEPADFLVRLFRLLAERIPVLALELKDLS
jgi:hypothetical protein